MCMGARALEINEAISFWEEKEAVSRGSKARARRGS